MHRWDPGPALGEEMARQGEISLGAGVGEPRSTMHPHFQSREERNQGSDSWDAIRGRLRGTEKVPVLGASLKG